MNIGQHSSTSLRAKGRLFSLIISGLLSGLVTFPITAHAEQYTGLVGARLEHTNNVRQSEKNPESDVIQRVYTELGVEEVRKRFKADAKVRLENEHYYEGTFDDETSLTTGFGLFTIDLVEDFLEWQATFSRTDVVQDSAQEQNPDTTEYRNIFRTGPTINYGLSQTLRLNMNANYIKVDNSDDTADNSERAEGSMRLSQQYNRLTSFNVSGNYSEVIDSDDGEEIENSRLTGGFTRDYTDGSLSMSYGGQEVRSNLAETTRGTYADVMLSRSALIGHNMSLKYNQSISDTNIGFEDDETGNSIDTDPTQSVSQTDIETRDRVNLRIDRDMTQFTYDFSAIYQESDFKRADYVERYRGLILGFQPKLYSRLTPRIQYSFSRESFGLSRGLGKDITHTLLLSADYQLIEKLFLDGFTSYTSRSNKDVKTREYDEFEVGLGIRWEFL
jgi:hypothetical protein